MDPRPPGATSPTTVTDKPDDLLRPAGRSIDPLDLWLPPFAVAISLALALRADQAGSTYYTAAPTATQTITVAGLPFISRPAVLALALFLAGLGIAPTLISGLSPGSIVELSEV